MRQHFVHIAPNSVLDGERKPSKRYDSATSASTAYRALDRYVRELLREFASLYNFVSHVRRAITIGIFYGSASLKQTAHALSIAPRVLQAALFERGTSYRELARDIRTRLAKRLLTHMNLSLVEIAALLGFAEHSAFSRAFKAWVGISPTEYRRARAPGEGNGFSGNVGAVGYHRTFTLSLRSWGRGL